MLMGIKSKIMKDLTFPIQDAWANRSVSAPTRIGARSFCPDEMRQVERFLLEYNEP